MPRITESLSPIVAYHNTIGLCTMEGRGFMFPVDTAFDQNGNIYTINRGHKADPRTIRITKYNIDSEFFGTFLSYGKKDGQLLTPSAIAIDKNKLDVVILIVSLPMRSSRITFLNVSKINL